MDAVCSLTAPDWWGRVALLLFHPAFAVARASAALGAILPCGGFRHSHDFLLTARGRPG